jgi:hypothetical protein
MTSQFRGSARFIAMVGLFWWGSMSASLRAQQVPRFDVFGGYSDRLFDAPSIGYPDYKNLYGGGLAGTWHITMKLGVTVDTSANWGSGLSIWNYMAGPQYVIRREKSDIYFQFLFGKTQNTANIQQLTRSGFESVGRSLGGGAGYDYHWKPRISIRVLEADYFHTDTFKTHQNDIRLSTGLVFHFGHKGHRRKL